MSLRKRLTTPIRHWLEDDRAVRNSVAERAAFGISYLNFWEQGPIDQTWFYHFLQRPALKHLNPSGLTFLSVFGRPELAQKISGPKVFFTGENLANYPAYADHLLGKVDLALGFANLPTPGYLRFPLWLLDLFPPEADLAGIQHRLDEMAEARNNLTKRPHFACFIARHDNNGLRKALSDVAEQVAPVDYAGIWRHNTSFTLAPGYTHKLNLLKSYRFHLCPENSNASGYVTEKIWHALAAGCIPVYWGSDNQPEPGIINPEAILFYDRSDPEALLEELTELNSSTQRLGSFRDRPVFLRGAAALIFGYYERLEKCLLTGLSRVY